MFRITAVLPDSTSEVVVRKTATKAYEAAIVVVTTDGSWGVLSCHTRRDLAEKARTTGRNGKWLAEEHPEAKVIAVTATEIKPRAKKSVKAEESAATVAVAATEEEAPVAETITIEADEAVIEAEEIEVTPEIEVAPEIEVEDIDWETALLDAADESTKASENLKIALRGIFQQVAQGVSASAFQRKVKAAIDTRPGFNPAIRLGSKTHTLPSKASGQNTAAWFILAEVAQRPDADEADLGQLLTDLKRILNAKSLTDAVREAKDATTTVEAFQAAILKAEKAADKAADDDEAGLKGLAPLVPGTEGVAKVGAIFAGEKTDDKREAPTQESAAEVVGRIEALEVALAAAKAKVLAAVDTLPNKADKAAEEAAEAPEVVTEAAPF